MLEVIRGSIEKQVAATALVEMLQQVEHLSGLLYLGYPILASADGPQQLDCVWISEQKGIVLFNFVQGTELSDDIVTQVDNAYNNTLSKLQSAKELVHRRQSLVEINVVTFAPAFNGTIKTEDSNYIGLVKNENELFSLINSFEWNRGDLYPRLLSEIQSVSSLRKGKKRSDLKKKNSRGAKLKVIEDSISTLDSSQSKAVIETVEGVQRIRGLAGSGKTVVLARKVAYLHASKPEWNIAVTFHTRALKNQLKNLIQIFCIEQAREEPDWDKIHIMNSWGSHSSPGIYYLACVENNIPYMDFGTARRKTAYGQDEFAYVCGDFLKNASNIKPIYDCILVDEAQDFAPEFLNLCYEILTEEKRLVYAYDELQSLNENSMKSPEDLWGTDELGQPKVSLYSKEGEPDKDIILGSCYRNPGPILTTAHALGFGIYREPMIQMFDNADLWTEIGYQIVDGELSDGKDVKLSRTSVSSPAFLYDHSRIDDVIQFKKFDSYQEESEWIASEIIENLSEDELRPSDIIVIHPNALVAKKAFGTIRRILFENDINSSIAGVTSSPDEFMSDGAVTFTSIYRAKGNEAAMVYVMSAEYCDAYPELHKNRNILFTAMTRTKAWVRVCGVGKGFEGLVKEFNEVRKNDFTLSFKYPTEAERQKMRVVNRDMTEQERKKVEQAKSKASSLASLLADGDVKVEDIPEDVREEIIRKLRGEH